MVTVSQLKSKIKKDAVAYDRLANSYNLLIKRELSAGHLIVSGRGGKVKAKNTTAGRNAAKRVVLSWNKVARKGKVLKSEIELFVRYQSRLKKRSTRKTSTRKRTTKRRR